MYRIEFSKVHKKWIVYWDEQFIEVFDTYAEAAAALAAEKAAMSGEDMP